MNGQRNGRGPIRPAGRRTSLGAGPSWLLLVSSCLIVLALAVSGLSVLLGTRETALLSTETTLSNMSLILAEQANRSIQALDLVLTNVSEIVSNEGVTDSESYKTKMSDYCVHLLLKEKLSGLPYINAITMIDMNGNLINFSRYWSIPSVNISDRDYFKAMRNNPALNSYISVPVSNRGDGTWTVYLARRIRGRDGVSAGLVLGAIELQYFEGFYRLVALGEGGTISLIRSDGVLLAHFPRTWAIGQLLPGGGQRATLDSPSGTVREPDPADGEMHIKSARRLADYPLVVLATQTEATALRQWASTAWPIGLVTGGCMVMVIIAAAAIARWWRQQRERSAEEASRAKSGFLAMMSHEIRTPMNAVLGLAGTLLDTPLSQPQHKTVEAIRDSGDNLLRILNDILDFSKLDAGRMLLEDEPFSPAILTESAVSILGPRAAAKGLALSASASLDVPPALLGDAGRIRQVLLNLMSNAVKFTERGSVLIETRCISSAAGAATLEWIVSDTGIGIAADRIDSLFGEFIQADSSITRRFGGSGLGLAISKLLVEKMGGTITVASQPLAGTIFRVVLTLPIAAQPPREDRVVPDVAKVFRRYLRELGRPLRVLFAEDNPTNQFVALQLLKCPS